MTTRFINGLAVEIDGKGEALLCIHGLGGSSNTWTPLLAALSSFKVIRPDLPGSARSALLAQPLSIEGYAATLEALLAELGVESVHVMAHSLGTVVAQHLAVRNPGMIKSLALFGPLVAPPEAARAAAARGGDQDGVAPPPNVAAMAARINGSRQVVLEGCGHWTSFEKPQRCMQELEQFHASLR